MRTMVAPATTFLCSVPLGVYRNKMLCTDSAWGLRNMAGYTSHSTHWGCLGGGKKKSSYLGPQRRGDFADKNQTLGFSYRTPIGSVAGVKTDF